MKLICTLFLSLLPAACVWAGTGEPSCSRKFDDQEIRDLTEKAIVEYSLAVDRPYRIEVNWSKCRYYVVIWRTDPPPSPDSEMLLTLDEDGVIIKRPGMQRE
jgi:hypothetical protein